jgi:hypothetical protein
MHCLIKDRMRLGNTSTTFFEAFWSFELLGPSKNRWGRFTSTHLILGFVSRGLSTPPVWELSDSKQRMCVDSRSHAQRKDATGFQRMNFISVSLKSERHCAFQESSLGKLKKGQEPHRAPVPHAGLPDPTPPQDGKPSSTRVPSHRPFASRDWKC